HWGINIAEREKTEKSLTEMQIEQNLKWEFSMTSEDGKELTPIFGKGFTGLKNLGNSCYLASILQCLFAMPEFANRYFLPQDPPPSASKPAEDLETQLRKVADGLLSGRYSIPDTDVIASEDSPYIPHQKGLAPSMLKHLVGRGHEEFSTMRQQDAFELLLHLFKLVTRSPHIGNLQDPINSFRFVMEQRLQCISCNRVRYSTEEQENISVPVPVRRKLRVVNDNETDGNKSKDEFEPVTLKECLDIFTGAEEVELTCPSCESKAGFTKRSLFKTFPTVLAVNARRFELINWVPTKLDVPVVVGDEPFDLGMYKSAGQQDGEELLPDDAQAATSFIPNQAALSELEVMGFPHVRCEKALHATGNIDADAAMNWILAHMDDPDVDTPVNLGGTSSSTINATRSVNPESVEMLVAMGISAPQARKALKETSGDMERAVDWVFSHPDDQGDFEGELTLQDKNGAPRDDRRSLAGSAELPARFKLQSIVCHKGASIHAGPNANTIRLHVTILHLKSTTVELETASGLQSSDGSNQQSAPLLAKSTQGATYLILLQIGSRALTFLVNQVLLRYLSPDLLGISTQLDLYSTSVLYFARESLRVALQRQTSGIRSPKLKENGEDQRKRKTVKSYEELEKIQEAVNLSYIAIGLGVPLACIFGYLYLRSADAAVLRTPFILESLITYTISTMLELFSEPCFIVSQQQMLYGTRASAESLATFTRCILTCASAIWASRSNVGLGAIPFAIGQLSYAIVLNLIYQLKIMPLSTQKSFSLLPKRVNSPSRTLTLSYFSTPHITLASNLYAQSVFKHLLTTGDALLIAALTSLESQGAYTLAANYGGLLARTIFQPIEESSRSLFGRLLPSQAPHQQPPPPS
ncbi:MAG: hypothetical protein Q9214_005556, partial [Letrouitia sp. 1 TL-2023]